MTSHTHTLPAPRALDGRSLLIASFSADGRYTTLLLRLALAVTILPHGIQKTLGWWGGYGFTGTMGAFTQMMGIPAPLALAAILAESLGAVLLFFGLFTRLSAFAIGVTMVVAASVHWSGGFFMPKGIEFFIPTTAVALFLAVKGGGAWALDKGVHEKLRK
jgi:putative oxidoreductase